MPVARWPLTGHRRFTGLSCFYWDVIRVWPFVTPADLPHPPPLPKNRNTCPKAHRITVLEHSTLTFFKLSAQNVMLTYFIFSIDLWWPLNCTKNSWVYSPDITLSVSQSKNGKYACFISCRPIIDYTTGFYVLYIEHPYALVWNTFSPAGNCSDPPPLLVLPHPLYGRIRKRRKNHSAITLCPFISHQCI